MKSFTYATMPASAYSEECWRLHQILHESKGRFDALRKQHQGLLAKLETQALVDNVDASARIDGIYLDPSRIQQLVDGSEAQNARECQIAGYARTLKAFQKNPERFPLDAATFLAMHTVLVGAASGKKSAYRQKDYVNMMMDGQVQRVPASPILAFETPLYLGSACDNLASAFAEAASRKLMMIPTFAVDVHQTVRRRHRAPGAPVFAAAHGEGGLRRIPLRERRSAVRTTCQRVLRSA